MSSAIVESCFASRYEEAFRGFQRDALLSDFELFHYVYAAENRPAPTPVPGALFDRNDASEDIPSCCSVARFGSASASRVLVILSGTHGIEGYFGSASQRALMQSGMAGELTGSCALLLIHAMNPWGFRNLRRTTENNVDLNRNFVDWSSPLPRNDEYAELHRLLLDGPSPGAERRSAAELIKGWVDNNGPFAFFDALSRGQYTHDDGLFFGGNSPTWSNRVLRDIVAQHCAEARRVAVIDWHTGLGEYAKPLFLCFDEPGTAAFELCRLWWGVQTAASGAGFDGAPQPRYSGLLMDGLRRSLPRAQLAGCVVEIGTLSPYAVLEALIHECPGRCHGPIPLPGEQSLEMIRDAFYPADRRWREEALGNAMAIQGRAIRGLISW